MFDIKKPADAPRHVYVIGPNDGPYKIGIACNVGIRLSSLQTGSPVRLVTHFSVRVAYLHARAIERRIHVALGGARIFGEWFNAPLETVIAAVTVQAERFSSKPRTIQERFDRAFGVGPISAPLPRIFDIETSS